MGIETDWEAVLVEPGDADTDVADEIPTWGKQRSTGAARDPSRLHSARSLVRPIGYGCTA